MMLLVEVRWQVHYLIRNSAPVISKHLRRNIEQNAIFKSEALRLLGLYNLCNLYT